LAYFIGFVQNFLSGRDTCSPSDLIYLVGSISKNQSCSIAWRAS